MGVTFDDGPLQRTKHPAHGCTKAQIAAFERIAINEPPGCGEKTLAVLVDKGLVERTQDKILGRDRFGEIRVPQYAVPIWHHIAWCEWCSAEGHLD